MSATSTSTTNESGLISDIEADAPKIEADVTAILQHPTGPFAGIVAWVEGEFTKLRAEMGQGKAGAASSPTGTSAPAKPPSPPAPSPAPAGAGLSGSGMSTKDSSEAEHKPASTTSGVGTGISGAPATPGGKE